MAHRAPLTLRTLAYCAGLLSAAHASCSRQLPSSAASGQHAEAPAPPAPTSNAAPAGPVRAAPREPVAPLPPLRLPAPARLVGIGDVHGDLEAFRAALRLAGAIDAQDHWSGGALVVVQTGDLLDRGDQERAIVALARRLRDEAARAGGAMVLLNGNHEIMNVQGDFRYVTPGGFAEFREFEERARALPELEALPFHARARAAAFVPGAPYARQFAENNTVVVVGDTVFVHGGLLAEHVAYGLERINSAVRAWMLGESRELPEILRDEASPVWLRRFALQGDPDTCDVLARALAAVPARRLVVGHTVQQQGANDACEGRVWRIDVGLARLYGGPTEVLEIRDGTARVLRASAAAPPAP